ncbi:MAG: cell division protein FtsQ [Solirubrobacteraceae bacterium]|jgi:cell division protein FtsQ|nr:cell division protein FtsQ [Solirubrobacteraceae bacterium]
MKVFKLGGVLALVAALYGGWLMLRDAPLFRVEKVQVTGLSGPVVPAVATRLEEAGRGMTTTHVDIAGLKQAVAAYTVIKGLAVHTEFPHGLSIRVIERLPVAALVVGGVRLGIAADGAIVHGLGGSIQSLPSLTAGEIPTTKALSDPASLDALEVLDIAPAVLRRVIARVGQGPQGLTVYLRNGPPVYFGDTSRLHAKWASTARVLGDPQSLGAAYLDVRLPDRPAAGVNDPATSAMSSAGALETAGAPLVVRQTSNQPSISTGG